MNKRTTAIFGILSVFMVFAFSVFVLFLLTAFFHRNNDVSPLNVENGNEVFKYQFLEYNPQTEETSFGMVSILDEVNDYLSYENEDQNYVLISHFGADEYKCEGNCYCGGRRRSAISVPVRKGLIYLVAAATSLSAYDLAQKHFVESCSDDGEKCEEEEITAEVFQCEMVGESGEPEDERKYFCEGNCMRKKYRTKRAKQMALEYGCEDKSMEGEVIVDPKDLKVIGKDQDEEVSMVQTARFIFQENYLHDYCYLTSQVEDITDFLEKGKKYYQKKTISMCVGKNKIGLNPTINCRMIQGDFECKS